MLSRGQCDQTQVKDKTAKGKFLKDETKAIKE